MKRFSGIISILLILLLVFISIGGCKKPVNPIKYALGTFPDSVYNLKGLNTQYDDYNSALLVLGSTLPIIFSSNRGSNGGQFDLVQGSLTYKFDQTTGAFSLASSMTSDLFLTSLISSANTSGNDFGPLSIFSLSDGNNYLMLASQNGVQLLDLYYLKYQPQFNNNMPVVHGPYPVKLLNSSKNDAYITFNANQDSAYFTSDVNGNYDILLHKRPAGTMLDSWFNQDYSASTLADSINSSSDDKCPFILKNVMIFTSNRPGGMGGFDLYYSIFKNGKWNAPVNLGPKINSSSDEYRPVLGYDPEFTNMFLIFSSNKSGGMGGYDLYFTGFNVPN
jgi:hypothetical protein